MRKKQVKAPKVEVSQNDRVPRAVEFSKPKTPDDRLAENLKIAEDALIDALEVLSEQPRAFRRVGYQSRLQGAQEAITGLYREELVRIRGPQRPERRKKHGGR